MRAQGTNLSHVKTTLAAFTANAAGSDFAPGTGAGVCETCHTTTTYYNNTGTGAPHETGVCSTCHTHDTGFTPPVDAADTPHDGITDCTLCHDGDDYAAGATLDNVKCLACHDGGTATLVETHHTPADLNCTDCHNVMRAQGTNLSHVKTTLAAFTANAAGSDFAPGTGAGVCETCHTTTTYYNNTGTGAPHETTVCTTCHTHDAGFTSSGGSIPAPHDQQACNSCHILEPDYVTPVANSECQFCHDSSAPGSNGVGWGDCRTETGTTSILAGTSTRNVSLTTPLADTTKAFLLVDSAGPQATVYGRDHTVSGYIAGTNTLTFEREGTTGQAEVSYSVVECMYTEFSVQRGEIQLANGVDLNTQTLGTPLTDLARSMVIVNARTSVNADQHHQASVIGQLLSSRSNDPES
jgi:hypothetical protein